MAETFVNFPIVRAFDVIQDQDWSQQFTYKIDGQPVNLGQYSAEFVVFDDYEITVATATSPTGVVLGGAAGTITPKLTAAVTDTLSAASFHYILWLIDGTGSRLPFARGRFNVSKGVSA